MHFDSFIQCNYSSRDNDDQMYKYIFNINDNVLLLMVEKFYKFYNIDEVFIEI